MMVGPPDEGVSAECAVEGTFERGWIEVGEGEARDTGSGGGANG